jgi:hypothetical protein
MFMATKKPTFKKQAPAKPSLMRRLKEVWWIFPLLFMFVLPAGIFAYNKYLDYRNVEDMKALLSDFQQLEKTMEEQTGEEFTIETDCSSVGKFATSYSCSIYLLRNEGEIDGAEIGLVTTLNDSLGLNCEQLFSGGGNAKNSLLCTIKVRTSNETKSEIIFYSYDKSPGSPY